MSKFKAGLIWFDFGIAVEWTGLPAERNSDAPEFQQFAAYYYNRAKTRGKTGIINYKHKAAFSRSTCGRALAE